MKYKILSDNNGNWLEGAVNDHLARGWQLHGGLQVAWRNSAGDTMLYQAVIHPAGHPHD